MSKGQKYHCGPDRWNPKARKALSFILKNEGCKIHDRDWAVYTPNKKEAQKIKKKGNTRFLRNQFVWWQPWTWIVAPISYAVVSLGGNDDFIAAQKKSLKKLKDSENEQKKS